MNQPLRLLIVDDSKDDAELLLHVLRGGGYEAACEVVDTPAGMRAALERPDWDVITSDHAMPQFSAPAALALAKDLRPDVPFIIVSGEIDLNLAVSLMRGGARDYIQKRELARLVPAIERVLHEAKLRGERALAVEALQVSESRYRRLFETAQDGILILDADTGQIMDANPFLTEMLGYSQEEFLGKRLWEIGPFKDAAASKIAFAELQRKGYIRYEDLPLETSDSRHIAVEFISNSYLVDHKRVIQCNIRNVTARKQAEAEILKLNAELEQRVRERTVQLEALNKDLETFNYSVSHDLRAPLRHVDSFVEALREGYGDELGAEGLKLIQKIRTATQRMSSLIDALLELSGISRRTLQRERVDLSALAHLNAVELQQSNPTRKVEFAIAEGINANGDAR
ncbi:MAG TPA: PAS domain S-box protein, partial [Burkholderiales bacterium]|nr:PAS domain S-box protein [Burkholderiales bacterium]